MSIYNDMKRVFDLANKQFLTEQKSLIQTRVSERTLCGQLMLYLDKVKDNYNYKEYHVDVEYNRNYSGSIKTIKNGDEKIININCDLILHSRGNNLEQDNLIAIEMKKSTGKRKEKEKDRERLKALTRQSFDNVWRYDGTRFPQHVCRYVLGVYYEINFSRMDALIEYYQDGELSHSYTMNIETVR